MGEMAEQKASILYDLQDFLEIMERIYYNVSQMEKHRTFWGF